MHDRIFHTEIDEQIVFSHLERRETLSGAFLWQAIILEFKVHAPEDEKTLEDTVQAALLQIKEKKYAEPLIVKGISEERIRKYGFAFEGKKVLIG